MKICLTLSGTSSSTIVSFEKLLDVHPMATVAWDRDGISELLSKIAPMYGRVHGLPRLYINDCSTALIDLYYGKYTVILAQFKIDPAPHWSIYRQPDPDEAVGSIGNIR